MDASSNIAPVATVPPARPIPWPMLLWFLGLLGLCFAPVLRLMASEWLTDDDMGHGLFVPLVAGYIAWTRRTELSALRARPNRLGLAVVVAGALLLAAGTLGSEMFVSRIAFLTSLAGVVLYLGGPALLKELAFPLFLLLFMIRIPAILYNQITFPLQLFASAVAERSLWSLGIPVLREGNILELPNQMLSVVEACSGIRSLLSLSFLSLVYAYFFDRKIWMRAALLVATIPIAIAANAFRVTLTGVLSEYRKEWAEGFLHLAEGWVIFLVSLACLMATHRLINAAYGLAVRPSRPGAAH